MFVGRLSERKGIDDLIDAVGIPSDQEPRLRCLIVGEGRECELYERQVIGLGLDERVVFSGWIEPREIPAYMTVADCLVGLSKHGPDASAEAQRLTFIEAVSVGTPLVATRSGGIEDAVRDGATGLLVEQASPRSAAAAIKRLLDSPELEQRFGENGRRVAREEFSRQRLAARMAGACELARDRFAQRAGRGR